MLRSALVPARVATALVLGLAGADAIAAEGRTPIFSPTTIVANGKYIVTRDITSAAAPCITISASDVDIDLNGFTLDQAGSAFPSIAFAVPFADQITIRNGTLENGSAGIEATAPGNKLVVEDVKIQNETGAGVHDLDIANVALRRLLVVSAGGNGILIDGAVTHAGSIEDCVVRDSGANGIFVANGAAIGIVSNRIQRTVANGISLVASSGSLVSENTVTSAGAVGIFVNGKGSKLYDNVVRGAFSHGIDVDPGSTDNLVSLNVLTGNGFGLPGGCGVFVEGDQNTVDRNTLNSNSGFGLRFTAASANNTFGSNTARANIGVGAGPCAGGFFPPNSCNDGVANTTFGNNLIPGPPVF